MTTHDFIIIGGGSAGAVVANRLSVKDRVLLLEAGPSDRRFWIDTPLGYAKTYHDDSLNWAFTSDPMTGTGGRTVFVPRGKVLGGSSAINAMVWIRGQHQDFDDWATLGNPGWAFRDVLPFFKRLENHPLGATEWHGKGGAVGITDTTKTIHPICRSYFDAASELQVAYNGDFNGKSQEGVGPYPINVENGVRESASRAYLRPLANRAKLRVETGARVKRILFEGRRAVGVVYEQGGRERTARAAREVILSAGAVGSPQLLQLSGVGPAALLEDHGIEVVQDLPAVGENLQDHASYDHYYDSRVPTLNNRLHSMLGQYLEGILYLLARRGQLAMSLNHAGGFVRVGPRGSERPNIQLYFCPLSFDKAPKGSAQVVIIPKEPAFSLTVSPCRPSSRGYVRIRSADWRAAPGINPNLLATEEDAAEMLAGARFMRRLAAAPSLAKVIARESRPGPAVESDEDMLAHIRANAISIFHPCGSCAMGPDPASAVVDARLRVHGLAGLRVIDASIFPRITSGNLNAPAMMVGERGAALVLEDRASAP